jgi:manganese/zinc/iron transport system substrate-binding protein
LRTTLGFRSILIAITILLSFYSCNESSEKSSIKGNKLRITCTTSIVADAVQKICGDKAEVRSLMGPGVDPHSYKASQGDLKLLREADIVFYNGLHLEGKMAAIFEKMGRSMPVYALTDSLDSVDILYYNQGLNPDPHIWFDPMLWSKCLGQVFFGLSEVDPDNKDYYKEELLRFRKELALIDKWALDEISKIPTDRKYLVTSHDAFRYFSEHYGIKVKALQGVSTSAEFGLRDVVNLVAFVCDNNIPALFTETSIPTKFIESVQEGCNNKGCDVVIGGELYSDALGTFGTYQGTYLGVFHHNVEQICKALQ